MMLGLFLVGRESTPCREQCLLQENHCCGVPGRKSARLIPASAFLRVGGDLCTRWHLGIVGVTVTPEEVRAAAHPALSHRPATVYQWAGVAQVGRANSPGGSDT